MGALKEERRYIVDDLEIIDIFRVFFKTKEKLWFWQPKEKPDSNRPIHFAIVTKVNIIGKSISIEPVSKEGFRFTPEKDIFLYSKDKNIAVKLKPRRMKPNHIVLPLPERISILSEKFASIISIVEKEDEQSHIHKRAAPRKQAEGPQSALIKKLKTDGTAEPSKRVGIYDVSPGGMGLKTDDPGEFEKDQKISVLCINDTHLPRPIQGTIISIRHIEEDDCFKIGIQFK